MRKINKSLPLLIAPSDAPRLWLTVKPVDIKKSIKNTPLVLKVK